MSNYEALAFLEAIKKQQDTIESLLILVENLNKRIKALEKLK